MAKIKALGRICIDPRLMREVRAACGGSVTSYPLNASKDPHTQRVLGIWGDEIQALQQRFLMNGGAPGPYRDDLVQMGMPMDQLSWILREGRPIKTVALSCPSTHGVDDERGPGDRFERGDLLFRHGPVVAACVLSGEQATFLDPDDAAIVAPLHWDGPEIAARVSDVWPGVGLMPSPKCVVLVFNQPIKNYPMGTPVSILINARRLPEDYDAAEVERQRIATLSTPAPRYAIQRGETLPPEQKRILNEKRRAEQVAAAAKAAFQERKPRPDVAAPKLAPPMPTRRSRVNAEQQRTIRPPMELSERQWSRAQIRTVGVERREMVPSFVAEGHVGRSSELGLIPRPLKDVPPLRISPTDPPEPAFVALELPERDFDRLAPDCVRVTVHRLSGPPVEVEVRPYGVRRYDRCGVPTVEFGAMLLGLPAEDGKVERVWVTVADTRTGPSVLAVPESAVRTEPNVPPFVLAHVTKRTLAAVPVRLGVSSGGYVEILAGIGLGEQVIFDATATLQTLHRLSRETAGHSRSTRS